MKENMNKAINEISTPCTSTEDLLKSDEFERGIRILLNNKHIKKNFKEEDVLPIFAKLKEASDLNIEEVKLLQSFLLDINVSAFGKILLHNLKRTTIKISNNTFETMVPFSRYLETIFVEGGYDEITKDIGKTLKGIGLLVGYNFGTPSEEQYEILKKCSGEQLKKLAEHKLKFEEDGTSIALEGETVFFTKEQIEKKYSYADNGRYTFERSQNQNMYSRPDNYNTFTTVERRGAEKLVNIFRGIAGLINLSNDKEYWVDDCPQSHGTDEFFTFIGFSFNENGVKEKTGNLNPGIEFECNDKRDKENILGLKNMIHCYYNRK